MKQLNTAVMGLDDRSKLLLEAISAVGSLKIVAVADKDGNLAEQTANQYDCKPFDDYRQLIIQNQLDCLLVSGCCHGCEEYIQLAIKKKLNVLRIAPAGKNFEQAAQLTTIAKDNNVSFTILNRYRFNPAFMQMGQYFKDNSDKRPIFISAICNTGTTHSKYPNDSGPAGQGVLLEDCFDLLDVIIQNFGIPLQVYCLNTNTACDQKQRQYISEDTAILTMKFNDTLIANMTASRITGPDEIRMDIHTREDIVTIRPDKCLITDNLRNIKSELLFNDDPISDMAALLNSFALSILKPNEHKFHPDTDNLDCMAVIESAYLSVQTDMPEQPDSIRRTSSLTA